MRGVKGYAIGVSAVEKFSSSHPLNNVVIRVSGMSHSALGGSFSLGVSLDGKTTIKLGTPVGRRREDGLYRGTHALDLREVPEFQSVREFYVHMNQRNGSGVRTNTSSSLNTLEIKDIINERTKHGTTMSELGNVLGKDPIFRKVKQIKIVSCAGRRNGNYKVFVWSLSPGQGPWAGA